MLCLSSTMFLKIKMIVTSLFKGRMTSHYEGFQRPTRTQKKWRTHPIDFFDDFLTWWEVEAQCLGKCWNPTNPFQSFSPHRTWFGPSLSGTLASAFAFQNSSDQGIYHGIGVVLRPFTPSHTTLTTLYLLMRVWFVTQTIVHRIENFFTIGQKASSFPKRCSCLFRHEAIHTLIEK